MRQAAFLGFMFLFGLALIAVDNAERFGIVVPLPAVIKQPVTAAVIVYETKTKHQLPQGLQQVIEQAPKYKVTAVDVDVVDKNGKTPATLKPFFDAMAGQPLPRLVLRRGQSTYENRACPDTVAQLQELVK